MQKIVALLNATFLILRDDCRYRRSTAANIGVILKLAERMIDKMNKDGKIGQEQETQLYLLVLELQHNFSKALDVIEGPLGAKLEENSPFVDLVPSKKLEYLRRLELWPRVNVLAKSMLQKSPDQWNVYLDYVTSIFRIIDAKENTSGESEDDGVDRSVDAARYETLAPFNAPKKRSHFGSSSM